MIDGSLIGESREAADALACVLDASTDYAVICEDAHGDIVGWNKGAQRLYGFEPDEAIGKSCAETLLTSEDIDSGKPKQLRDAVLRDGRWEGVVDHIRKGGARLAAHLVITSRRSKSGDNAGF